MVKSLLSSDVDYIENKSLLPEDKNQESSIYEITLYGDDETIALGQPVYTFIERNIVYYPIYLVKNDKVTQQIGLYEVFADSIVNILDSDGDVDISLIGQPLLYEFVSAEKKALGEGETFAPAPSAEKKAPDTELLLEEQTAAEAEKEREAYDASKGKHWIQVYFKNNNYRMIDNEGKGDCLFAVIRDALAKVGVYKSVDEMRGILAANVTEDIFRGYKTVYDDAAEADAQLVKEIKTLIARHNELKSKIDALKDRNAKQAVIMQADEIKKRHDLAKRERAYTKSVIEGELKMMKKVHNLIQFKALMQTCAFWGDTWAISTLERVLNIKVILFSEESYRAEDIDNVLTCGQLNDTVLEEKGIFEPDYYILAIYQGYHYQMISYKDRGALTFKELPYDIKTRVVDKCLERLAGPYYIIPEFRIFMEQMKNKEVALEVEEEKIEEDKEIQSEEARPQAELHKNRPQAELHKNRPQAELLEEMQSDLFDNGSVFQFYIKSLDKPPGKGVGEVLSASEALNYKELSHIPDWRRKLDNFWQAPFTLDGHKWQSVEHYYQGSKYKRGNPEFYLQFSLDSGSVLSKDTAMAKDAGGKSGKYLKEQIRPLDKYGKNMKVDEDFLTRGPTEKEAAQYAKFTQNADLKELLKSTKKAKLQHFSRGSPPVVFYDLMRVRSKTKQV